MLFALVSAAGFSTLGVFAKLIYSEGFSVPQALAWRFTIASAILWAIIGVASRKEATRRPPLGARLVPVMLLGLFGFAPQAGLYFVTLKFLDPGITSLLLYLYPSFVILFSLVLFRTKPNKVQVLSLVLSLSGCAITFFRPGEYPLVGLALGAFVAVAYGAYLVAGERVLAGVDPIRATAVIMLEAAVAYWSIAAATGPLRAPTTPQTLAGVIGIALFATVLPITTLFASMRLIGAANASLVSTLEPLLTVALSAAVLGERLGVAQALGGALILAAVVALRFAPGEGSS
jgi:drug/metabolite transporter (DMT)-like permease